MDLYPGLLQWLFSALPTSPVTTLGSILYYRWNGMLKISFLLFYNFSYTHQNKSKNKQSKLHCLTTPFRIKHFLAWWIKPCNLKPSRALQSSFLSFSPLLSILQSCWLSFYPCFHLRLSPTYSLYLCCYLCLEILLPLFFNKLTSSHLS